MTSIVLRRSVPWNVAVLLVAIAVSGFAAAWTAGMPALWLVTPFMALMVVYGWLTSPAPDPDADPRELPAPTRARVRETLRTLPAGNAARLLRDVVRPARSLFASSRAGEPMTPELLRDCTELLDAACATAAELSRLEGLVDRDASALHSRDRRALRDNVEVATAMLSTRLAEAGIALGELYVQRVEHGTASSDRLHEIARELDAEVSARRRAMVDLESLLR